MARLFAFLANRPDLGAKVLQAEASLINPTPSPARATGWGVGFYQGGEILLRRRPVDDRPSMPLASSLADLRTTALLGHVRLATVGTLRTENTHPFRFRQWLFAHTGNLPAFPSLRERLIESIPQFLRRNVRGETDSELIFHLFLSFLHDAGGLDRSPVAPAETHQALRSTLVLLDRLSAEEGAPPLVGNIALTDGEAIVALHAGAPMAYRVFQGRHDLGNILGDEWLRRARSADLDTSKVQLMVADYEGSPSGFTPVPDRSILTLTRANAPTVEPL
ncbi:MAG: class II glutamine amidotransferase [Myxococcales bacterium]|nr:class II glutamine amidotransferase [Polyangiaceae bacterium]MDW8250135.1 class II glutamine amidotransferase [Myxococcales bacterium]